MSVSRHKTYAGVNLFGWVAPAGQHHIYTHGQVYSMHFCM